MKQQDTILKSIIFGILIAIAGLVSCKSSITFFRYDIYDEKIANSVPIYLKLDKSKFSFHTTPSGYDTVVNYRVADTMFKNGLPTDLTIKADTETGKEMFVEPYKMKRKGNYIYIYLYDSLGKVTDKHLQYLLLKNVRVFSANIFSTQLGSFTFPILSTYQGDTILNINSRQYSCYMFWEVDDRLSHGVIERLIYYDKKGMYPVRVEYFNGPTWQIGEMIETKKKR